MADSKTTWIGVSISNSYAAFDKHLGFADCGSIQTKSQLSAFVRYTVLRFIIGALYDILNHFDFCTAPCSRFAAEIATQPSCFRYQNLPGFQFELFFRTRFSNSSFELVFRARFSNSFFELVFRIHHPSNSPSSMSLPCA